MDKLGNQWYFCVHCFQQVIDYGNGAFWKKELKVDHKMCLENCIHYKGSLNCNIQEIAFIKDCDKYKREKTKPKRIEEVIKQ